MRDSAICLLAESVACSGAVVAPLVAWDSQGVQGLINVETVRHNDENNKFVTLPCASVPLGLAVLLDACFGLSVAFRVELARVGIAFFVVCKVKGMHAC